MTIAIIAVCCIYRRKVEKEENEDQAPLIINRVTRQFPSELDRITEENPSFQSSMIFPKKSIKKLSFSMEANGRKTLLQYKTNKAKDKEKPENGSKFGKLKKF